MDSDTVIQAPPPPSDSGSARLIGYAAIWGRPVYNPIRGRFEVVTVETFSESLALARPVGFPDPADWSCELAGTADASLILSADAVGLRLEVLPQGAPGAFEALAPSVAAGLWGGAALLYTARATRTETQDGLAVEVIERADLLEVMAVPGDPSSDLVLTVGEAGSNPPHAELLARRNAALASPVASAPGRLDADTLARHRDWLRWLRGQCARLATLASRAELEAIRAAGAPLGRIEGGESL